MSSTSTVRLQNYLNANDGGTSSNIPSEDIDGLWGPQTTEKLLAVLHDDCGYSADAYGAIDGKNSSGQTITLSSGMMNSLAACLNAGVF